MENETITIRYRSEGTTGYVSVAGEIDYSSVQAFRTIISQLLHHGCSRLLIHSQGVTYCDSSGLSVIAAAIRHLRPINGSIGLIRCPSTFRQVLAKTRFDRLIQFYENVCEATENAA
jgi:anti-sigma B factor antagonist